MYRTWQSLGRGLVGGMAALLLVGCLSAPSRPARTNYVHMAKSMVGTGISTFMLRHRPNNVQSISDNHKLMTFSFTQKHYPSDICNVTFAVEHGVVSGSESVGNGCR